MKRAIPRYERRGSDRPRVGDTKPCGCGKGVLEFTEHYRWAGATGKATARIPAWVCDVCPRVVAVRAEHQPTAAVKASREVRARANRHLMKARFVVTKAKRALRKSLDRKGRS